MQELESKMCREMVTKLEQAKLLGCDPSHLIRQLETQGALTVMQQLARRGQTSELFEQLHQLHHLELSPEAVAVQSQYAALFTDAQANYFLSVLCECGYWG